MRAIIGRLGTALATTAIALLAGQMAAGSQQPAAPNGVREFQVDAKRWEFVPARLEVIEGDTVRIVVKSTDSTHGLGIKAFRVNEEIPKSGEPVTIEFVADRPGEFEIKCTEWCGRGHRRMKGVLVVAPRASETAGGRGSH